MSKEGKYICRLSNNVFRESMMAEIEALKNQLKNKGSDVNLTTGIIYDLGLYCAIAELRKLNNESDVLARAKAVKLEKDAAKVIQENDATV